MTQFDREPWVHSFNERVRFNEPLARHVSFRIGGPADVWVEVSDAMEIRRVQALAAAADLPLFVLGGGTNILVSDRGVRGVVLHLGRAFAALEWHANGVGQHVRAGAALPLKKLVTESLSRELAGLEFAEGIPGTVGGGLLMNAGAFGGELSTVIESVEGVDCEGGIQRLQRNALRFGYRFFDLPRGFIVTHLQLLLHPGDRVAIHAQRNEAKRRREARQPLGYPNAGSIFKNPPDAFAGKLIEATGLKGRRCGGAMISEQHANFIVNVGGATAADVHTLMAEIVQCVEESTGTRLEPEIKLVGEW